MEALLPPAHAWWDEAAVWALRVDVCGSVHGIECVRGCLRRRAFRTEGGRMRLPPLCGR